MSKLDMELASLLQGTDLTNDPLWLLNKTDIFVIPLFAVKLSGESFSRASTYFYPYNCKNTCSCFINIRQGQTQLRFCEIVSKFQSQNFYNLSASNIGRIVQTQREVSLHKYLPLAFCIVPSVE